VFANLITVVVLNMKGFWTGGVNRGVKAMVQPDAQKSSGETVSPLFRRAGPIDGCHSAVVGQGLFEFPSSWARGRPRLRSVVVFA
jgi:hypothetical protein